MTNGLSSATARLWTAPNDPGVSEPNIDQGNYFLNTSTGALWYCQTPTAGIQAWNKVSTIAYSEQTAWTPAITGGTVAGTGTYTAQNGYYTRIGNMIFLAVHIAWSAHTGTGDMTVTGLPFPSRNSTNYDPEGIINPIGIPLPGGVTSARTHLPAGTSTLPLFVLRTNNTNDPIQMNATGELHVTIAYLT